MSTTLTKPDRTVPRPWFRRGTMQSLRDELQDVFSNFFGDENPLATWNAWVPSLDLSETDGGLEVRMDVPGVKAEDVEVQMNGTTLTVTGKRSEEKEEKGKTFHRMERSYGEFTRSVTLPCEVKEDKVEAQIRDGVLTIRLQKCDEAKTRKIKVQS